MASAALSPPLSKGSSGLDEHPTVEHDSVAGHPDDPADPAEAKRIMRKIDWRLIPLLGLLYMLTFLDRVNIGNARLWNLERDLGMDGYDYNIAVLGLSHPATTTFQCQLVKLTASLRA